MLMFSGTYKKPCTYKAQFNTYRDDNGAHLTVLLDDSKTVVHVRLEDGECERLGKALIGISHEEPPF